MIEPRRSVSGQTTDPVLKEYVWGAGYVDELVPVGINQDPQNAYSKAAGGAYDNRCERFFWVCQDANYNVLGLVNERGDLVKRYEYTPGACPEPVVGSQRTIYTRGANRWVFADVTGDRIVDSSATVAITVTHWQEPDTDCLRCDLNGDGYIDISDYVIVLANWQEELEGDDLAPYPVLESFRHPSAADLGQVAGLCDVGHQGLLHDKEFGLIHNRARALHRTLARFLQRDPSEYVDGISLYQYVSSRPPTLRDSSGAESHYVTASEAREWIVYEHSQAMRALRRLGRQALPGARQADLDRLFREWRRHSEAGGYWQERLQQFPRLCDTLYERAGDAERNDTVVAPGDERLDRDGLESCWRACDIFDVASGVASVADPHAALQSLFLMAMEDNAPGSTSSGVRDLAPRIRLPRATVCVKVRCPECRCDTDRWQLRWRFEEKRWHKCDASKLPGGRFSTHYVSLAGLTSDEFEYLVEECAKQAEDSCKEDG